MPDVSVVIPVRDGERSLPALLDSLERQSLARERYEVIVVDNASRDATAQLAAARGAQVVTEPVPNRSRARNAGVAHAAAPLLAFTDADCVADEHWLAQLLAARDRAPLVAGRVELQTAAEPNAVERFEKRWRFSQRQWVEMGWAATANLLVHREAFEQVGGFDPAYRHIAEDADFCIRAQRAGFALAYTPDALVLHDGEAALGPLLRRSFFHGYSANQAHHRLGLGHQAWRAPRAAVASSRALEFFGVADDPSLGRMAKATYAARLAGSVWAELRRAR